MKIILSLLIFISIYASSHTSVKMFNLYKNKNYKEACSIGYNNYKKYKKDEQFLSIYAFSCLKADYIDRLANPIAMLKYTKESRKNAAYFSVILMQKKLLYHALVDNAPLHDIKLATTKHVLSKIFDMYANLEYTKKDGKYIFKDKNNDKMTYLLYVIRGKKLSKIVIEELYDTMPINKHIYW